MFNILPYVIIALILALFVFFILKKLLKIMIILVLIIIIFISLLYFTDNLNLIKEGNVIKNIITPTNNTIIKTGSAVLDFIKEKIPKKKS